MMATDKYHPRIPHPVEHTLSYSALRAKTSQKETYATANSDVIGNETRVRNVPL